MFAAILLLLPSVLAATTRISLVFFKVCEWLQKSFRNSFTVLNKAESAEKTELLRGGGGRTEKGRRGAGRGGGGGPR